jgi:predicted nucleic acid-binding protein
MVTLLTEIIAILIFSQFGGMPVAAGSRSDNLTRRFARRLHGHNQVTDACLLGLAIREGLVLTTFDKALLHLAGEHKKHVLVLSV